MIVDAPLQLHSEKIISEWIDYNGHMNLAYYVLVFDHATDVFLDYIGLTEEFREQNQSSTFAAEIHTTYEQEVMEGDEVIVRTRLLDFDEKRIHYFHQMYHKNEGWLSATNEVISLYVDMDLRKVSVMPSSILECLGEIEKSHRELPVVPQVCQKIGIKRK